jgi:hypothetical protein
MLCQNRQRLSGHASMPKKPVQWDLLYPPDHSPLFHELHGVYALAA